MLEFFRNLVAMRRDRNEAGASAVEYGLLVIGIAAAVLAAVVLFTGVLDDLFSRTSNCVDGVSTTSCTP